MSLFLGIDLGTSYVKIGVFDEAGRQRGFARTKLAAVSASPGRAEVSIGAFWDLLRRGLDEALAGTSASQISGVSYASQANSFVLLDGDDAPLTPLVLWSDLRSTTVPEDLARFSAADEFSRVVGFGGWSPYSAVVKLRWFRENRADLWGRAHRMMTISDYLTFSLTGERAGDSSTAAFLGLYDLERREWWPDALRAAGVDIGSLSTPLRPGSTAGRTCAKARDLMGLPAGIPFSVGGLDHHIGAIGAGVGTLADMSLSIGTVLAALALVTRTGPRSGCFHGPHADGTSFYRLAFDPGGTGQLDDYRRTFAPDRTEAEFVALAASSPPGTPPAPGGPARHFEADVAGGARRILDRMAATQRRLVEEAGGDGPRRRIVATGGGARSPEWLQLMADAIGLPIAAPRTPDAACLGAALLASVGAGAHPNLREAARAMVGTSNWYQPKGAPRS